MEFSPEDRINEIWTQGKALGLRDADIYHVLTSAVEEKGLRTHCQPSENSSNAREFHWSWKLLLTTIKMLLLLFIFTVVVLVLSGFLISTHNPTRKFITRNIQDLIYPVMSRLRRISMPLLDKYPAMSSWYTEECLVENPFFDHVAIDCYVCSDNSKLHVLSEVKNFTEAYYNNGHIVVINGIANSIPWKKLISGLNISKEENLGAWKVTHNSSRGYSSVTEGHSAEIIGEMSPESDLHIEWKINRLETLHILRRFLPRFHFIPKDTEVSFHHLVLVDGQRHQPYPVPISEFANVVLVQGEGSSAFTLEPSPHCEHNCQSVSLTLNVSQVLFFNWVFWRPTRTGGGGISTLILSSFY